MENPYELMCQSCGIVVRGESVFGLRMALVRHQAACHRVGAAPELVLSAYDKAFLHGIKISTEGL